MNKRLPYEEELSKQLNDLPLPDESISWEDMRRKLDEDDDDGVIIPPVSKGCLGYSLLLMLLAMLAGIIGYHYFGSGNKHLKAGVSVKPAGKSVRADTTAHITARPTNNDSTKIASSNSTVKNRDTFAVNTKKNLNKDVLKASGKKEREQVIIERRDLSINDHKLPASKKNNMFRRHDKKIPGRLKSEILASAQATGTSNNRSETPVTPREDIGVNEPARTDSIIKKAAVPDTVAKKIDKEIKDREEQHKKTKKDSLVNRPIYFAAGIALHQQLPINGQKLVPYNSLGRKSTLGDYIPSVYLRMYKDKRWFVQAEFRYGAPQYTKDVVYVQKKIVDTFTRTTRDTSNHLKKTYYHQLPVSFSYFVLPHFSIGAGVIWNKFSSAVSEQEVKSTNNITQVDSVITKTILHPKNADTNFVKSYFQAVIETQYQWKRWSLGGRYSFGLQPYIRFQLPGGQHRDEKNSSLEIFLRYDLWQSRKK